MSANHRATSSDPRPRRSSNWAFAISCLLCVLLAVGLRIATLPEPLWLDELHSGWVVSGTFMDVVPRALQGNQSPLWYLALFGFVNSVGGASPLTLRLVSVVAGILLVVSVGWLVRRCGGQLAGATLAMALAAIDDTFIYYAIEARPYACLQLVGLWQLALFGRIAGCSCHCRGGDRQDQHGIYAFWAISALLLWIHLTAVAWLLVEAVVLTGMALGRRMVGRNRVNGRSGKSGTAGLKSHAIPFALFLASTAALVPLVVQVRQRAPNWMAIVSVDQYLLLVVATIAIYLLVPWVASKFTASRATASPALVCHQVVWITVPIVLFLGALVASGSGWLALADVRFTLLGFTALPVATGLIVSRLPGPVSCGVVALATVAVALATNPLLTTAARMGQFPAQRTEDWESVMATINSSSLPVILVPNLVEDSSASNEAAASNGEARNDEEAWHLDREFALRSLYPLEPQGRLLVTGSLHGDFRMSTTAQRIVVRERGVWLLVRAHREDALHVLDQVLQQFSLNGTGADAQGASNTTQVTDFSRPPLFLFRIDLIGK